MAASLAEQSAYLMAVSLAAESDEMTVWMTADLLADMMATKLDYLLEVLDTHKKGEALLALLWEKEWPIRHDEVLKEISWW